MDRKTMDDLWERAARTFWQGAVASAPVVVMADWSSIRAGLTAAGTGGLAAVLSAGASWLRAHSKPKV